MNQMIKWLVLCYACFLVGCATKTSYDYTEYKKAHPRSILVLPPKNSTPDVQASNGFYARTLSPLSEAGYYVMPITLVSETFKNNGIPVVDEMHKVDIAKLRQIFGADAALYIDVKEYGGKYTVINSVTTVAAEARLVDLRSGKLLWAGKAKASSDEGERAQTNLAAILIGAIVKTIAGSVLDQSFGVAGIASSRLLSPSTPNGMLYGPRSPWYKAQ